MNLRVERIERSPLARHSTDDGKYPHYFKQMHLIAESQKKISSAKEVKPFSQVLCDTIEISAEGRAFLENQNKK